MFRLNSAAEMAAWILSKSGGSMDKIKLNKLMYLSEREYIFTYARPISDDEMVSHDFGPVLEQSDAFFRNGPKNNLEERVWRRWFKPYDKNDPILHLQATDFGEEFEDKFSTISTGACRIMDALCQTYKDKTSNEMVAITHSAKVCPEWNDPIRHGKHTITIEDLCRAHGIDEPEAKEIIEGIEEARDIALMWEDLKAHEN